MLLIVDAHSFQEATRLQSELVHLTIPSHTKEP
jgi:hypothetical protein